MAATKLFNFLNNITNVRIPLQERKDQKETLGFLFINLINFKSYIFESCFINRQVSPLSLFFLKKNVCCCFD